MSCRYCIKKNRLPTFMTYHELCFLLLFPWEYFSCRNWIKSILQLRQCYTCFLIIRKYHDKSSKRGKQLEHNGTRQRCIQRKYLESSRVQLPLIPVKFRRSASELMESSTNRDNCAPVNSLIAVSPVSRCRYHRCNGGGDGGGGDGFVAWLRWRIISDEVVTGNFVQTARVRLLLGIYRSQSSSIYSCRYHRQIHVSARLK